MCGYSNNSERDTATKLLYLLENVSTTSFRTATGLLDEDTLAVVRSDGYHGLRARRIVSFLTISSNRANPIQNNSLYRMKI